MKCVFDPTMSDDSFYVYKISAHKIVIPTLRGKIDCKKPEKISDSSELEQTKSRVVVPSHDIKRNYEIILPVWHCK